MTDNGIIDEVVDPKAYQQLKDLDKGLESNAQHVLKLVSDVEKLEMALNKVASNKDYLLILEEARKKTAALTSAQQELQNMQTQRHNIQQRVIAMHSKEAIELERVRQKQAEARKELSNYVRGSQTAAGSITAMRAELSKLTHEYDNMSKAVRNSDAGRKAAADIKALSDELKQIEAQTGRTGRNVGNYFESIKKGLKDLAGMAGIALGLKALFDVFKNGYKTIVDFEQANANLAAIIGKDVKEISQLTESAKALGASTAFTASEVTNLQTELAKLGFDESQIMDMQKPILNFATAMRANLADAAEVSGVALRAFNLDAAETDRVVSVMAQGANISALDFDDFKTAMANVAPVAASFGYSIEDTVSLLGVLSNAGFDASSASTALRNIILNLADANGKLAVELGGPAKTIPELSAALKELQDRGIDVGEALELTDKRSVAAFLTLTAGTDTLTDMRNELGNTAGVLERIANQQLDTVQGATLMLKSAWEGLMLSFSGSSGIFKSLINILTGFVTVLISLVKLFSEYAGVVKTVAAAVIGYVAAVKIKVLWTKNESGATILSTAALKAKTAMMKLATAASWAWSAAVSLLTGNIKGATYAFKIFTTAVKASPIGLIAGLVAGAVTAFMALRKEAKSTEDVINGLREATENYINGARKIDDLIKEYESLKDKTERTKEENERLNKVMKLLAKSVPDAAIEFDKYGNILSINTTKVKEFSAEQKKAAQDALKYQIQQSNKHIEQLDKEIAKQQKINETGIVNPYNQYEKASNEKRLKAGNELNILYAKRNELIQEVANSENSLNELTGENKNQDESTNAELVKQVTISERIAEINKEIAAANERLKSLRDSGAIVNIAEIEAEEATIKKLTAELKILQGEEEKLSKDDRRRADEAAKLAERIGKAKIDLYNLQAKASEDAYKQIINDEKSSYSARVYAASDYAEAQRDRINTVADYEAATLTATYAEEKKKFKDQKDALANLEKAHEEQMKLIREKQTLDIDKTYRDAEENRRKIAESEAKRTIDVYTKRLEKEKALLDAQEKAEIAALNPQNVEIYEAAKTKIQEKYAVQRMQTEADSVKSMIDGMKIMLEYAEITGEQRFEISEKIALLETQLAGHLAEIQIKSGETAAKNRKKDYDRIKKDYDSLNRISFTGFGAGIYDVIDAQSEGMQDRIRSLKEAYERAIEDGNYDLAEKLKKDVDSAEQAWAEFAQGVISKMKSIQIAVGALDLMHEISNLASQNSEKRIQGYDDEIDKINERRDTELDALEKSAATDEFRQQEKARLEARAAAQTQALEDKKRQEQIKQANWEKAWAITQIAINTAAGVMKAAPNVILMALIGAMGAVQAAIVASKPIPHYAEGTDDHPGGPAVLNDAGKREVVRIKKKHAYLMPAVGPTVMDLPKHAEVFPDVNAYRRAIASQSRETLGTAADLEAERISYKELLNEMKLTREAIKSQKPASLHVSASSRNIWKIVRDRNARMESISKSLKL